MHTCFFHDNMHLSLLRLCGHRSTMHHGSAQAVDHKFNKRKSLRVANTWAELTRAAFCRFIQLSVVETMSRKQPIIEADGTLILPPNSVADAIAEYRRLERRLQS
eukprot:GILJ01013049.1.p1 GENE.GILJ01013049.1~~GILJ01013049.1.p1  ORF type:complete len:105 (+),score=8.85 GILJ01013049.1:230-544(+)